MPTPSSTPSPLLTTPRLTTPRLTTALLATLMLAIACDQAPDIPQSGQAPAATTASADDDTTGLRGGQLIYKDTFDGSAPGESWQSGYGGWKIEEGRLRIAGAKNDALWLQTPLPENFRVSFEATALSEVGDLKFEILGDGQTHESGYIGIFGGWNNSLNIIARLDEHGDDRLVGARGQKVEPERTYTFTIVRTDKRLRWFVDGKPFLTYADEAPLQGEGHRYFAFNNWQAPAAFDNLEIYDLGAH
ncbi:hypothetical protein EA187_09095 [Lujinxingia sediminis]|uniref:Uncharacterized protein n=1 Tax=Lujinxingia sediminis TaxID=2480984 RepID=A0ABY0CU87_9DELT|nr:hypothetical protein [Lujinxingia sediminis]RVU45903.1 hypothetical protein EA187_09095 [Lujinxingia sediminis]